MALTPTGGRGTRYQPIVVGVVVLLGLVLTAWLWLALAVLGGQPAALCHDPPILEGQLPQLVILGASAASFLLGGLTSGWPVPPTHTPDHQHVQAALQQRRVRMAMRVTFIFVFLLLTALMLLEVATLYLHVWPITSYVRCSNEASAPLSALGAGIYSFLAGRWLWVLR